MIPWPGTPRLELSVRSGGPPSPQESDAEAPRSAMAVRVRVPGGESVPPVNECPVPRRDGGKVACFKHRPAAETLPPSLRGTLSVSGGTDSVPDLSPGLGVPVEGGALGDPMGSRASDHRRGSLRPSVRVEVGRFSTSADEIRHAGGLGPGSDSQTSLGCTLPPRPSGLRLLPIGGNSHRSKLSEPKEVFAGLASCGNGHVFREVCDHGRWRWKWAPCNRWRCEACQRRRIATELVPEIRAAVAESAQAGQTLKLLTLTYRKGDLGAEATQAGARRRSLDLAHLAQYVRRDRKSVFEYLRAPEEHRSGAVHLHLVVMMPYVAQAELSARWQRFARGSFRVDIRPVYMRCPRCWPGRGASEARRKRSSIVPWPGNASCPNCGYCPADAEEVVRGVAWEAGKYVAKSPAGHLTRSKAWPRARELREPRGPCAACGGIEHRWEYCGRSEGLFADFPGLEAVVGAVCRGWADPQPGPCGCWADEPGIVLAGDVDHPLKGLGPPAVV